MPTLKPVIPLGSIDAAHPIGGVDVVAEMIPHRGSMLLLDRLIWHDESYDHGVAGITVREDAFWADGHIPGYPLMPGVLMVEAGAQLASWLYYKRCPEDWFAGFTRIEDTTFRGQVRPGDELLVLAACLKYSPKRFVSHIQGVVNGQICFDGKITGMAMPQMGAVERRPLTEAELARTNAGGSGADTLRNDAAPAAGTSAGPVGS
jgi:3-hydroxyacyl-[acyl-carrier-protein] dehydratase